MPPTTPYSRRLCHNSFSCHNLSGHSFRSKARNLVFNKFKVLRFLTYVRNDNCYNYDTVSPQLGTQAALTADRHRDIALISTVFSLSLIHISEPTRRTPISY